MVLMCDVGAIILASDNTINNLMFKINSRVDFSTYNDKKAIDEDDEDSPLPSHENDNGQSY